MAPDDIRSNSPLSPALFTLPGGMPNSALYLASLMRRRPSLQLKWYGGTDVKGTALVECEGTLSEFYHYEKRVMQELCQGPVQFWGASCRVDRLDDFDALWMQLPINSRVKLWIASPGRETLWHSDPEDNLVFQVVGSKRWRILDPKYASHFPDLQQVHPKRYLQSMSGPDTSVSPIEVVLKAGDCMYVPKGWLHHVDTLDFSVSYEINIADI
jgi:hypothetical protein